MSTECPVRESILKAVNKYKCTIYRKALDNFVNLWNKLYGCSKLHAIEKYVWVLAFEWCLNEDEDGYEIDEDHIKELEEDYILPDFQLWEELKDKPELVEELKQRAHDKATQFEARDTLKQWERISTPEDL